MFTKNLLLGILQILFIPKNIKQDTWSKSNIICTCVSHFVEFWSRKGCCKQDQIANKVTL